MSKLRQYRPWQVIVLLLMLGYVILRAVVFSEDGFTTKECIRLLIDLCILAYMTFNITVYNFYLRPPHEYLSHIKGNWKKVLSCLMAAIVAFIIMGIFLHSRDRVEYGEYFTMMAVVLPIALLVIFFVEYARFCCIPKEDSEQGTPSNG